MNHLPLEAESDDAATSEAMLALLYEELRKLAASRLSSEAPGQTLQATALVHEAYLRLLGPTGTEIRWDNHGHFFAAAAEAMRRILVENARRKKRLRHGGGMRRIETPLISVEVVSDQVDILALDDALKRLAAEDELAAKVVELRYFAGLGQEQAAAALGLTAYRARQKWNYARAWLRDAIRDL